MTDFGRISVLVLTGLLLSPIKGQEADHEIGSKDISSWVNNADSIVVGTLRVGLPLPWLDGWHYSSEIDVTDRLAPEGQPVAVRIDWVRQYGTNCLICNDLRPLNGRSGIWFLQSRHNRMLIFGGTSGFCFAPLELRYLKEVKEARARDLPRSH